MTMTRISKFEIESFETPLQASSLTRAPSHGQIIGLTDSDAADSEFRLPSSATCLRRSHWRLPRFQCQSESDSLAESSSKYPESRLEE